MTNLTLTACFSGYRPEKFPFDYDNDQEKYEALCSLVCQAIIEAVGDGYGTFMCGMARGFDLLAGEVLIELRQTRPDMADLKLVAVSPFSGQKFCEKWMRIHNHVLGKADEVITLVGGYHVRVFWDRNLYLVEHSSRLICYHTGSSGGTAQTLGMAKKKGIEIVNLACGLEVISPSNRHPAIPPQGH